MISQRTNPQSSKATPRTVPLSKAVALVVFGRDKSNKSRASAFDEADAELAERAAGVMNMAVWRVGAEHQDLARKLTRGRVFASGLALVPLVSGRLFASIEAAAGPGSPAPPRPVDDPENSKVGAKAENLPASTPSVAGGAPPSPAAPTALSEPPTAAAISLNCVVLASEGAGLGYFEAIVTAIDPRDQNLVVLRWRDYDLPKFARRVEHLALMPIAQS